MKIAGRKTALTYAGAESKFGITWETATPSEPKHSHPEGTAKTASSNQCWGQATP